MDSNKNFGNMTQCRYGTMTFNVNDRLVGESLTQYGEWAEQEIDLLGQLLQPGQSVVEVGGNLGAQTLWFSRTVGDDGMVYVTEPHRLDFQHLCANVAINGLTNVHAMPVALGREMQVSELATYDPSRPYRQGRNLAGASRTETTTTTTLDALKLSKLALIKIAPPADLIEVLGGAIDTIKQSRPAIYFTAGDLDEARNQFAYLRELGYQCWSHPVHLHNPANYNNTEQNVFPGQVMQNVLALPLERSVDFPELVRI